MKKYSKEFKKIIIDEYLNSTEKQESICKKYNISIYTIKLWIKKYKRENFNMKYTKEFIYRILTEYNNNCYGATKKDICKKFNIKLSIFNKWIAKNILTKIVICDIFNKNKINEKTFNNLIQTMEV